MTVRCVTLALAALFPAGCVELPADSIGERWYIGHASGGMDSMVPTRRLERDGPTGRVIVELGIAKYRFYPPDCVIYHTAYRHHQVLAVCGDRTPVPIASAVSLQDWALDDDGVRRIGPPWNDNGRFMQQHEFLPLEVVLALARQQPPFRENWAEFVAADARMKPVTTNLPADLRARDPNSGETPLMPLVRSGRVDLVDAMLAAGADVDQGNVVGWTPLMQAASDWQSSDGRLVARLIAAGAELDARDNSGHTALMLAAGNGSVIHVRLLLDAGANAALRDSSGRTAADHAADQGNPELIRTLREAEKR